MEVDKIDLSNNLIKSNVDISILKLEELLEQLEDMDLLNSNGKLVRKNIWEKYIKK